jgi:HPt (histidine-containing phosphotransfer) domain-containing protein
VRRAAHTLKSNAATFGAGALAECSREIEVAAREGSLEDADRRLEAIARALDTVREELPATWHEMSQGAPTQRERGAAP